MPTFVTLVAPLRHGVIDVDFHLHSLSFADSLALDFLRQIQRDKQQELLSSAAKIASLIKLLLEYIYLQFIYLQLIIYSRVVSSNISFVLAIRHGNVENIFLSSLRNFSIFIQLDLKALSYNV